MWEIVLDTLTDSVKMLPFLFAAYLIIEYVEHKKSHKIEALLAGTGRLGFLGGAILGCVPQCGFSVAAANFYAGGVISMGTLVSVFIATSDEAVPVLLTHPGSWITVCKLLAVKIVIAALAGLAVDFAVRAQRTRDAQHAHKEHIHEELCEHCGCEQHGIFYASLKHTASVFAFILIVSFVLNALVSFIGEERLSVLLMQNSALQPVIAVIIGLIPNCAASVVLTELLISGALRFGSAAAGLCAGAGVGLLVLFRVNRNVKENLKILGIVAAVGIAAGWLINAVGI